MDNPVRFAKLLPQVVERFVDGKNHKKYFQRFDTLMPATDKDGLSYDAPRNPEQMTDDDWRCHFKAQLTSIQGYQDNRRKTFLKCSYAIRQTGDKLKWICWDGDNQNESDLIVDKIIPWLAGRGFQYILEHSQPGHCHLWVFLIPYLANLPSSLSIKSMAKLEVSPMRFSRLAVGAITRPESRAAITGG